MSGAKPKPPGEARSRQMVMHVTPRTFARVTAFAKAEKMPRAELLRRIMNWGWLVCEAGPDTMTLVLEAARKKSAKPGLDQDAALQGVGGG